MDGFSELKTLYSQRIQGLNELNITQEEFIRIVKWLGNSKEVPDASETGLDSQLVLRIQLDAANELHVLETSDWQRIEQLVKELETELARTNAEVSEIENCLATIAPNLNSLLDPRTAAKLIFQYKLEGLATKTADSLVGRSSPLAQDPFVLSVPVKHQKQCLRMLASKTVLAARVDGNKEGLEIDGQQGVKWRKEIESRLAKLMAPPPSYKVKALPVPNTQTKPRRGGKRIRKQKQKNLPSQLEQEANLVKFASSRNV